MSRLNKVTVLILLCLLTLFIVLSDDQASQLQRILEKNELRIATRIGPLTYQPGEFNTRGMDYELAVRFARYLGVKPSFHPVHQNKLFSLLKLNKVDIAAANLAISKERMQEFLFGPEYLHKSGILVGDRSHRKAKNLDELSGFQVRLIAGSRFESELSRLRELHPQLEWQIHPDITSESLLDSLENTDKTLALIDSTTFARLRFIYPELEQLFELMPSQPVAWAFRKQSDLSLYLKAVEFFQILSLSGELKQLEQYYLEQTEQFEYLDSLRFIQRLQERLPEYKTYFQDAADETGLDWRLLAAISYQESHWDKDAQSFTGVKGLMMLTNQTARQHNIEDRTDPQQSIRGGALHLRQLLGNLPERITSPDRLWLALAAYNIGRGHLEDARIITQKQGANPDHWEDVKHRLKLLADDDWHPQTRHGKARGHEPVHFVKNVRRYYDVLKSLDKKEIDLNKVQKLLTRDLVSSPVL